MEQIVVGLFEHSLIGGAFVYLLWYVTNNFRSTIDMISTNMENMGRNMNNMGDQLEDVSKTLGKMNDRMEKVELRMEKVERGRQDDG